MRKDFCSFLLSMCPCLRVYGNITSSVERNDGSNDGSDSNTNSKQVITRQPKKFIIPHVSIESPD